MWHKLTKSTEFSIIASSLNWLMKLCLVTELEKQLIYCLNSSFISRRPPSRINFLCNLWYVVFVLQIHGKTELVTSSKRPVPLTWHFSMKNSLLPLLDEKGTRMNRCYLRSLLHLFSLVDCYMYSISLKALLISKELSYFFKLHTHVKFKYSMSHLFEGNIWQLYMFFLFHVFCLLGVNVVYMMLLGKGC